MNNAQRGQAPRIGGVFFQAIVRQWVASAVAVGGAAVFAGSFGQGQHVAALVAAVVAVAGATAAAWSIDQ
ncbi:MAG: hypothetical protein AB7P99_19005 [Vicinamibacterales bacterium]